MVLHPLAAFVPNSCACCEVIVEQGFATAEDDTTIPGEPSCCGSGQGAVAPGSPDSAPRDPNPAPDDGCDCHKQCCDGRVQMPITVTSMQPSAVLLERAERCQDVSPQRQDDPARSRLKRPPKAPLSI